jgi:hypothetical protein
MPAPESKATQRLIASTGAAAALAFIVAEPYLFSAAPGLQLFQGALVVLLWALVMFGGGTERGG